MFASMGLHIFLGIFLTLLTFTYSNFMDCPDDKCINQAYGYKIADINDCHGYFICHGEVMFQQYCPPGSKFVELLQECVVGKCPPCERPTPGPTPSPSTPTQSPPSTPTQSPPSTPDPTRPDCSLYEHGTRLPHETHCRFFWQCVEGTAVRLFCELGMWYDRENFVCNYPNQVKNCPANRD